MATLIRPDRCERCRHVMFDIEGGQYACRRNPPVPSAAIAVTPQGPQQIALYANFPPVLKDWWCGEFVAKSVSVRDA